MRGVLELLARSLSKTKHKALVNSKPRNMPEDAMEEKLVIAQKMGMFEKFGVRFLPHT